VSLIQTPCVGTPGAWGLRTELNSTPTQTTWVNTLVQAMADHVAGPRYHYDALFYKYQREGASRSARALLPHVVGILRVRSVLDVGCGAGAWLAAYGDLAVSDHLGVDGDYVDRSMLLVAATKFIPRDISIPFDLARQFDLVQCLEVGEHIPTAASATLVDNIVRHGKLVLFSAAVPGQGGEDHINEQPYEFWRTLFAQRSFRLFDFLRPRIQGDDTIEPWYRRNVLFFAHDDALATLAPAIISARVPDGAPIRDFSSAGYRLRKALLRTMPSKAVSSLAILKHRLVVRSLNRR
jgi:SAM-dependent methyltransferase